MGRRRTMSIGLLSLLGLVSVTVAGTFGHGDYSYLTSESNHYSPVNSYYLQQPSYQHEPHTPSAPASSVSANPQAPVVRKNRGIGHTTTTTYISASPIYVKSPLSYYPEAHVFSDPLPIVSLPQLPTQFLTLSAAAQVSSDSTGTKKARKGRRGKSSVTTPAPVEEEEEDETQETEGDSPASQGGYSSPNQQGGSQQSTEGATGGYPGGNQQQEKPSGATEGATGGYPSNLNANARESQGRTRSRSRSRSNRNRSEEENVSLPEETEAGEEEEEVADSVEDNSELSNDAEAVPESDSAPEVEVMMMRGRSKGGRSSGKKSRRGKGRAGAEEEAAVLLADGYKIPSIFVPTFGNNVLNTVYPAYSQNTLLKSLQSEVALLNQGYPESDSDIDTVSLVAEGKKTRKSKKRTSARKNRPGNRGRSSSGRSRASSARSQEPNQEQNQGGYSNPQEQQQSQGGQNGQSQQYGPPPQQSSGSQNGQSQQYGPPPQQSSGNQNGQSQQYGPPQFTPGTPTNQYGPPSSQQNSGISPPPQQGGGYQTINNELRGRTSDIPRQAQVPALIEPRQVSQSTVISSGDSPLPRADPNDPATAELIRTVQAILQRYPN